jgi:hypothetical protein
MVAAQPVQYPSSRWRPQAGLTLLEVILGLAILAVTTVGLNQLADRWADDTSNTVAAGQVRTFGEAVKSYVRDNYAAVQQGATATAPVIIDVPTLIAAQKLPAGYVNSNALGQATCALVLGPAADRLQAMIVTEGGKTLGDPNLATVASTIGGSGGGVYTTDAANITGAVGGWRLAAATYDNLANNLGKRCDGSAGKVRVTPGHPMMALWFENGDVSSAFVARDAVPGRPELNAMSTPLVMNSIQPVGAACTANGAIAQDGAGKMLSCQGGTWKTIGDGSCQPTSADLDTLQQDGRCYNGVNLPNSPAGGDWVFVEVYRHFNPANFFVTQRVIGMTGDSTGRTWLRTQNSNTQAGGWGGWLQIADRDVSVGPAGNLTARAAVNGASVNAAGNLTAGQGVIANGNITSAGGVISTPATVQGGFLYSTGDVQATGSIASFANAVNHNGTNFNMGESWAYEGLTSAGGGNAEPQSARGSAYLNDVFLRSRGQWVSQLNRTPVLRLGVASAGGTSVAFCQRGETLVAGSCYGEDQCSGNDWSGHGGFPSGNSWVCPGWHCNTTFSFATCM